MVSASSSATPFFQASRASEDAATRGQPRKHRRVVVRPSDEIVIDGYLAPELGFEAGERSRPDERTQQGALRGHQQRRRSRRTRGATHATAGSSTAPALARAARGAAVPPASGSPLTSGSAASEPALPGPPAPPTVPPCHPAAPADPPWPPAPFPPAPADEAAACAPGAGRTTEPTSPSRRRRRLSSSARGRRSSRSRHSTAATFRSAATVHDRGGRRATAERDGAGNRSKEDRSERISIEPGSTHGARAGGLRISWHSAIAEPVRRGEL